MTQRHMYLPRRAASGHRDGDDALGHAGTAGRAAGHQHLQHLSSPTGAVGSSRKTAASSRPTTWPNTSEPIPRRKTLLQMGVRAEQQALAKWGLNYAIDDYLSKEARQRDRLPAIGLVDNRRPMPTLRGIGFRPEARLSPKPRQMLFFA
jgi:hypothetical protein